MSNIELKEQMIRDSLIILRSVDWTEREIDKKTLEFELAMAHNKYSEAEKIRLQINNLLSKLNRENENMDKFMEEYRGISNEEKRVLCNTGKEESAHVWRLSSVCTGAVCG